MGALLGQVGDAMQGGTAPQAASAPPTWGSVMKNAFTQGASQTAPSVQPTGDPGVRGGHAFSDMMNYLGSLK